MVAVRFLRSAGKLAARPGQGCRTPRGEVIAAAARRGPLKAEGGGPGNAVPLPPVQPALDGPDGFFAGGGQASAALAPRGELGGCCAARGELGGCCAVQVSASPAAAGRFCHCEGGGGGRSTFRPRRSINLSASTRSLLRNQRRRHQSCKRRAARSTRWHHKRIRLARHSDWIFRAAASTSASRCKATRRRIAASTGARFCSLRHCSAAAAKERRKRQRPYAVAMRSAAVRSSKHFLAS
mmetsp:Transcript_56030/g.120624  ORF Transcript_56030/g.120624 Transcript_56030/m.120624 type:complete len:239 (-) Transcript_56030:710-1426(-)